MLIFILSLDLIKCMYNFRVKTIFNNISVILCLLLLLVEESEIFSV